jgi:predicted dehydrogenase
MDSSPSLGFAVVGCGLIGRKRAAAIAGTPGCVLRAVCDTDRSRAEDVGRLHGAARVETEAAALAGDPGIAAAVVATANAALAPVAQAFVRAGKHVLIEKPGGLNSGQLRALAALAQGSGARVRLGYNHRFHPALLQARALLDAGALGPLMFLRGRYGHGGRVGYEREWRARPELSGGGELIDQGVHLIDLASWILGDFTVVEGHATTAFWKMPVDDNAFLSLRTAAGQTAWLHVSCTEWRNLFSLEIYGRAGKLAIEGLGGSYGPEKLTHYRMRPEMGPPDIESWEYVRGDDSWAAEIAAFVDDLRRGRAPVPGLAEGIRTLEIVETLYRASGYPVNTAGLPDSP